ncbi:MAG: glucose-6-phosphate isomerase [Actinomycetota bacterium]
MSLLVTVSDPLRQVTDERIATLVADRVASRLFAGDATIWGTDAQAEAQQRLGWVAAASQDSPHSSWWLVEEIAALRADLDLYGEGPFDHVVLAGMGGSSLAPEVICATAGRSLTVLDSSDPDAVRAALADRLASTVVVISSKSGGTVETDSQRRAYRAAFEEAGLDPATRIVVVTDPNSPLEAAARADGHRVILADPEVGGRYSALTAFGLVPSGLAGVDTAGLLAEAMHASEVLAEDSMTNPALVLGAALAGGPGYPPLPDKLAIATAGTSLVGFADWAEQLIAESTGKMGTGLLPVVVDGIHAPEITARHADVLPIFLTNGGELPADDTNGVSVAGPLGGQFLLWEAATAVAGYLLGINPFDQPDVESAKLAAREMLLSHSTSDTAPVSDNVSSVLLDGDIEIHGTEGLLTSETRDLGSALAALLAQVDHDRGYLAVMAYLDRSAQADLAKVRAALATRIDRPVTFGWGPRFLHSTGQYHKGGPTTGVYLQITGEPQQDLDVPGQTFSFGDLIAAQAAGDAHVLAHRGRPVLRLHLHDRGTGLPRLMEVFR